MICPAFGYNSETSSTHAVLHCSNTPPEESYSHWHMVFTRNQSTKMLVWKFQTTSYPQGALDVKTHPKVPRRNKKHRKQLESNISICPKNSWYTTSQCVLRTTTRTGDIGECWMEFVYEYQQIAADYKLTAKTKTPVFPQYSVEGFI